MKTNIVSCHTADSKPVKQEVSGTVILPPLVFPEHSNKSEHTCFVMSKLVELGVCQIHYGKYAQIIFQAGLAGLAGRGVVNRDTTICLDGRPSPISLIMSSTNS